MYNYFVSFSVKKDGAHGFGNTTITSDQKLTSMEIINDAARMIEEQYKLESRSVVILNFQPLENE